jgi:hypothetical protein
MKTPLLIGLALCALLSCSGQRGRIMSDTDQDFVGSNSAGAATFDRLVSEAVEKLLKGHSASDAGLSKLKIAVLNVENKSAEELGDWQDQIYALISTSINTSQRYDMISQRFVGAALREARMRPEELFIAAKRRTFIAILESQGQPVDALLFPELTSGTTSSGADTTQRNYVLRLELVDVQSGRSQEATARLRKEYQR